MATKFDNHSHNIKAGDHLVHIYEDKKTLLDSVCNYVVPGLTSDQGVVIIATPEHIREFESNLERRSIDVSKVKFTGQLIMVDAHETLQRLMKDGELDPVKFNQVIGSVLTAMSSIHKNVRAYGEMVSILWNSDRQESAIQLEKMWTELSHLHNFSLLCGYNFNNLESSMNHPCFNNICGSHSHIITKDGFLKINK